MFLVNPVLLFYLELWNFDITFFMCLSAIVFKIFLLSFSHFLFEISLYNWTNPDQIHPKAAQEEGLPSGSSLSCTLFLIFLNDISYLINSDKALFADDLVIWHTDLSTITSHRWLQEDLKNLEDYCSFWKFKINTSKTVYTIFTLSHTVAKRELTLTLNNKQKNK